MHATLQVWHSQDRGLIQRTLDGLRSLDRPATCRSTDPIRGYAHAHQVMATHATHHCPRYTVAAEYAQQARS
ncbi:hypothetical protein [Nocardia sp. NPDC051750]|uniref:hypothetical protein n=1 Tax=Nocardia sp. NPDC051750 TaxID=3364325 RepID=UPI003798C12E